MYCKNCGHEINDNAVVCINCGCSVENKPQNFEKTSTVQTVAKVFMILSCVSTGFISILYFFMMLMFSIGRSFMNVFPFGIFVFFRLIPLCWQIPMTIHYFNCCKEKKQVGTAFKVCSLLFVNLIAGILMLCDNSNQD